MLTNIAIGLIVVWLGFLIVAWMKGGLGAGRKFGNKLAGHLNINKNLFHSLLDNGIEGPSLQFLGMLERTGMSLQEASMELGPSLQRGIDALESRFGRQAAIDEVKPLVSKLVEEWEQLQEKRNRR